MVYTFFDESDVSIVTVKKYLQTQFPTFKFRFDSIDGIQYLLLEKSLFEKVHISIKNNTIYFYKIDTPKLKKYHLLSYILGYFPGIIFKNKNDESYRIFRDKVVNNMLENIPKSVYDSKSESLYIDSINNKKSIAVNG